jgi:diguanylate cyclase (GGDEF)-like protein
MLLIDVDLFKQWNDRHGHVAGDCALRAVAASMRAILRPTDLLARYGGEEFAVLLPGAGQNNARDIAERLRASVEGTVVEYFDGRKLGSVTISIGAAELQAGATPEAFIEAADRALYRAKDAGRNRVEG